MRQGGMRSGCHKYGDNHDDEDHDHEYDGNHDSDHETLKLKTEH